MERDRTEEMAPTKVISVVILVMMEKTQSSLYMPGHCRATGLLLIGCLFVV